MLYPYLFLFFVITFVKFGLLKDFCDKRIFVEWKKKFTVFETIWTEITNWYFFSTGEKLTNDIEFLKQEKLKLYEELSSSQKENEILRQTTGDLEVRLMQMNEVKGLYFIPYSKYFIWLGDFELGVDQLSLAGGL
jgi:hypothetical protein